MKSARLQRFCRARLRAESPVRPFTSTKVITPWEWPSLKQLRNKIAVCALMLGAQACFIFPRSSPTPAPKKIAAQPQAHSMAKADSDAGIKPYSKVVTAAARTREGLFKTHRIADT